MSLIKFRDRDDRPIFINPESVIGATVAPACVVGESKPEVTLFTGLQTWTVVGHLLPVVEIINRACNNNKP